MKKLDIAVLLSFTAGFVDTASFLGLEGLFTAHVTGNFVTLGATLVYGTHGVLAKLLALPEFVLVVALTRLAGAALAAHRMPALPRRRKIRSATRPVYRCWGMVRVRQPA
jgi:uncharacterized membrane protein YoaK (UPF0700 family)